MKALVTGASGFVGGHLIERLLRDGHDVRALTRAPTSQLPKAVEVAAVGDFQTLPDCSSAMRGCDVVMHLAARVHVMHDTASDPLAAHRKLNVDVTRSLAEQAAAAGVRRFIYLSSIKVNGEETAPNQPFSEASVPTPRDPYGVSKLEAETALREVAGRHGMEFVVIRPPLVYGRGVRANFASMMKWVQRGVPLPLGAVTGNRRSLVSVGNLVDLITVCAQHPGAANQIFLVSDGHDLSTTELLRRLGTALDRPARLLPVPASMLGAAASMLGKGDVARRLLGSLQVSIAKATRELAWRPPVTVDEGLRAAASGLREAR